MLRHRHRRGRTGHRLTTLLVAGPIATMALAAGPLAPFAAPTPPKPESLTAPARATEPVILTGSQFPLWSAGPEVTARAPQPPTDYGVTDTQGRLPAPLRSDCYQASPTPDVNGWTDPNHGDHNCYQHSQLPVRTTPGRAGVDPQSLRGYRWTGSRFVQIPFQVDTKWVHYVSNNASGFAFYSGVDQVTTYTFDREGFRFTTNAPFDPQNPAGVCHALPAGGQATTPDPNKGLIDTDEMVFMARDAAGQAPSGVALPAGIVDAQEVAVFDPITAQRAYVYVMRSATTGPGAYAVPPAYTAQNSPYVHYARDPNADTFVYSQSSYSDYGAAPKGPVCTPDGQPVVGQGFKRDASGALVLDPSTFVQRRPLDTATVTTPRYRFRYDGRWVMDSLQVSPDNRGLAAGDYGSSIVDRWKARAFQQSPGGNTPCCGYEEEQNNWGGSSQLMGERAGPVRVIRVTWGADSSTNNIRTEVFYPEEVRYQDELRVHPIPPLDGIYVQRDMAAGHVTRYYNPYVPQGVPVDGLNDEAFGNLHAHVGPDGVSLSSSDTVGRILDRKLGGPVSVGSPNDATCSSSACVFGDFDVADPTFSGPPGLLQWEEVDGPAGAVVERWNVHQVTAGAVPETLVTMPYYRDDSCFDDGTGTDPGPKLHARSKDEPATWGYDPVTGVPVSPAPAGATAIARRCWNHHADGTPYNLPGTRTYDKTRPADTPDPAPDPAFSPQGDVRYYQGDIATHGLHVNLIVDSDNADTTVPLDEIDTEQRQVVLPPNQGPVGERYGHSFDKPLVAQPTRHMGAVGAPVKPVAATGATTAALPATGFVAVAGPAQVPAAPAPSLPPAVPVAAAGVGAAALLRRLVLRR